MKPSRSKQAKDAHTLRVTVILRMFVDPVGWNTYYDTKSDIGTMTATEIRDELKLEVFEEIVEHYARNPSVVIEIVR